MIKNEIDLYFYDNHINLSSFMFAYIYQDLMIKNSHFIEI